MKRLFKRIFATVSVVFILSALILPCYAVTQNVTFQVNYVYSWGWSAEQQNALTYLEFANAERSSFYSYSSAVGQTVSFISDYVDGSEALFVIYNHGYYRIKLGIAKSSPWTYLNEVIVPPATGSTPGIAVVTLSMLNGYTGSITLYTYSSFVPTYVGSSEFDLWINYYDETGTRLITSEGFDVISSDIDSSGYFKVPSVDGLTPIPSKIYLGSLPSSQLTFDVYTVDYSALSKDAYQNGYDKGNSDALKDLASQISSSYNNGYSQGLNDGLLQNELTYSQIQNVRTDYNVFTAFFDGVFNGLIDLWDTVTNGISFGGVSLNNVITSLIVIVVVVLLSSFVINRL